VDGVFSVNLGGVFPLLPNLFPKAGVWLGLSYDEEFLEPRQPFCSVPYAIRSSVTAHSDSLGNLTETSINNRFTAVENRVGSNEDDIEDLEVDIGSFEDGIGDLEDSVAVHRDNIDELYTLVGGEDACCPLEMYVDGSFVDIVVSRGALTIINTGTFTLGCESPVQFYGSIGMPILPLPEGGQSVYMTVNLMDDSNTLVQNSQLVGGTAFISYRALTIATPVNPGTYYLRITIGYNADEGADDIVFDGWEAGAIYQECPAIPGR